MATIIMAIVVAIFIMLAIFVAFLAWFYLLDARERAARQRQRYQRGERP